jgi:PAS domain S-box-containing protein
MPPDSPSTTSGDEYRRLLDAMPEALAVHAQGRIRLVNPAWRRLFGRAPDEDVAGEVISEHVHPDDRAETERRLVTAGVGDSPLPQRLMRIRRADGLFIEVEVRSAPSGAGDGAILTTLREVEPTRRLYAALSRVNEAVARESSFEALCRRVCRIVVEQGGLVSAIVRMLDARRQSLVEIATHGPRPHGAGRGDLALEEITGIATAAFLGRQRVVVGLVEHEDASSPVVAGARSRGIRSAAALPLLIDGAAIGTLSVFARDDSEIDSRIAELLAEIADALAFAHARFRAESRIVRLSAMYGALSSTNAAIARERDWHTLCMNVCRIVVEQGGVVSAVIRMPSADAKRLDPIAGFGPRIGGVGTRSVNLDDAHPAARAYNDGLITRIGDVYAETELVSSRQDAQALGIRSSLVTPLKAGGQCLGVLSVYAAAPDYFDDELEHLFADLGANLAFARQKQQADRATAESEAHYRMLVDASPDAVRVICDDRIVMINPAGRRLFALDPGADIIGRSAFEFIHPDHRARSRARLDLVIESGRPAPAVETRYVRPDGSTVDVEVVSLPFTWHGRPAALSIIRDLTERRQSQRALEEAEARYRALVEGSSNGVMIFDGSIITYANPGAALMLGLDSPADCVGRPAFDFIAPSFQAATSANLERLMAQPGLSMPNRFIRLVHREGNLVDVDSTATSIDLADKRLIQVELRDVTRERRALAEIRSLNQTLESRIALRTRELTEANRDLESFSYSVAHDLRAPLRAMAGFAKLLETDLAEGNGAEVPRHIDRITRAATRMNELIDGLLAVARVTHGAMVEARVNMNSLVAQALEELAPHRGIAFDIETLPEVDGDPVALRQVWTNLLSNAIKYSARADSPRISIGCSRGDIECAFRVRDNGVGFDPAFAARLFGVFERLHGPGEFEGTGVGLAVVRRIIERHGGRVWADGSPGAGATFHFTLPATRCAGPA